MEEISNHLMPVSFHFYFSFCNVPPLPLQHWLTYAKNAMKKEKDQEIEGNPEDAVQTTNA